MQRITITIDDELLDAIDTLVQRRGYASRSEAVRDMVRDAAARDSALSDKTQCVAALTYVYDHETRALAQRLTRTAHHHHDLAVASLHVHLDHDSCMEISILRGSVAAVRGLTDELTAQRGVRHTNLHLVPAEASDTRHGHGERLTTHTHVRA
jgi:CopG family nickel-responsive transcriptional regulator